MSFPESHKIDRGLNWRQMETLEEQVPLPGAATVEEEQSSNEVEAIEEIDIAELSTKNKRKVWKEYEEKWLLEALRDAKANGEFDPLSPAAWKADFDKFRRIVKKIQDAHSKPKAVEENGCTVVYRKFTWQAESTRNKWKNLIKDFRNLKRLERTHTGGGEVEYCKHEQLLSEISPKTDPSITPVELVESGKGVVATIVNEDAKGKEKKSVDKPDNGDKPETARKRRRDEQTAMNKKLGLLIDRQLSSDSHNSGNSVTIEIQRAQLKLKRQENKINTMGLLKELTRKEQQDLEDRANAFLE